MKIEINDGDTYILKFSLNYVKFNALGLSFGYLMWSYMYDPWNMYGHSMFFLMVLK